MLRGRGRKKSLCYQLAFQPETIVILLAKTYRRQDLSSSSIADGFNKKGDVSHRLPIPQFSFAADGLSSTSAVIPTHAAQGKNVTIGDLEALLHKALDGASGDEIGSSSGSGSGEEQIVSIFSHCTKKIASGTRL